MSFTLTGRTALALVVWVNLTLICQGHEMRDHQIGPHLLLFDAVDHPAAGESHHTLPGHIVSAGGESSPFDFVPGALRVQGANMQQATYNSALEAFSLSTLALVVLQAAAVLSTRPTPLDPVARARVRVRSGPPPEPPPPRFAPSCA